jgi:hypothetical protein
VGLVVFLYAVLSIALLSPMASDTPTSAPDLSYHLANIVQAKLAIDQGQIPLRTAPLSYKGWGHPLFQFYGQLPYTVAGLVFKFSVSTPPSVSADGSKI